MKKKLEDVLKHNRNLSEEQCQVLLASIWEVFEKETEKAFMEGYQYAISMLEDGIVKKYATVSASEPDTE